MLLNLDEINTKIAACFPVATYKGWEFRVRGYMPEQHSTRLVSFVTATRPGGPYFYSTTGGVVSPYTAGETFDVTVMPRGYMITSDIAAQSLALLTVAVAAAYNRLVERIDQQLRENP